MREQVTIIEELLQGKRPKMPTPMLPYIQAQKAPATTVQAAFDDLGTEAM